MLICSVVPEASAFAAVEMPGQMVISENGLHALLHLDDCRVMMLNLTDTTMITPEICENHSQGLMYYRQLTPFGSGGTYYGCFWHAGRIYWYDLSASRDCTAPYSQLSLNFPDGVVGFLTPFKAFAITEGGYVIFNIRNACPLSEYPITRILDIPLHGKPVVFGNLLIVSDRITGRVAFISVFDITHPVALPIFHFSGSPDLSIVTGDMLYFPLGRQGIGRLSLENYKNSPKLLQ